MKKMTKAERIEASNKAFESMTPEQRRVAIAKDVIAHLKSKKLVATSGQYCQMTKNEFIEQGLSRDTQLLEVFENIPTCEVCARGSMFVSSVLLFDNLKIGELPNYDHFSDDTWSNNVSLYEDDIAANESRYFSRKQTALIECAFEGSAQFGFDENTNERIITGDEALAAARMFPDEKEGDENPEKRLIAIMENIITNNGEFVVKSAVFA